jgi:hypothetical protein
VATWERSFDKTGDGSLTTTDKLIYANALRIAPQIMRAKRLAFAGFLFTAP